MRKRIYTPAAIRWEANPLHELGKIKAREMGITVNEAVALIRLQDELAKV